MELRNWFESLISNLLADIVSSYLFKSIRRLFPDSERFFVTGRAWVTSGDVRYAGQYQEINNPDHIVTLRRGGKFPAASNGDDTSWKMVTWDTGEAEEAARGCRESIVIFVVVAAIAVFIFLYFRWLFSMMPSGVP